MKRVSTIFTTLLLVLGVAFTASAQWQYEVRVNAPVEGVIPVIGVTSGWGLQLGPDSPLTADVVVMSDETGSELGCAPSAAGAYDGKIVLIRRGTCGFLDKAGHAFNAGAAGIILVNTDGGAATNIGLPANVTADLALPVRASQILIPVVMVDFALGDALIQAVKAGATGNVSITRLPINPGELEIIWGGPGDPNSEFDGGFNDWTAVGVSCDGGDAENAAWQWMINPISVGNFAGVRGTIASLSSYNGGVVFDSDFLDNAGLPNNFGNGVCASPHRAELISPVIDLSNETSVAVRFNQYFRRFAGAGSSQAIPASLIEVTNDGGNTWTTFTVNTGIAVNSATVLNDVQIVDISAVAAGRSAVQFRFVFDGDYYFWQIDDVYLVKLPDNSLGIQRVFSPIVTKYTPVGQVTNEFFQDIVGWPFAAAVRNFGGNIVDNAQLRVRIVGSEGNVEFDEAQTLPALATGTEETIFQPTYTFDPTTLRPGSYTVTYTLFQEGITDFNPIDNSSSFDFTITDNTYWQSGDARTTVLPANLSSATWAFGALIETVDSEDQFRVTSIETFVSPQTGSLEGVPLTVYMVKILEGLATGSQFGDGSNEFAAFGELVLSASDNNVIVDVPIETLDGEIFTFENNTSYYAMVEVPSSVRIGCDNLMANFPLNLAATSVLLYSRLYTNDAFATTFRNITPYVKLNLEVVISTDEQVLPETYVNMFPNPASDQTYVNLNFDTPMNATVTLLDLNGKVINYVNIANVSEHTEIINTSALAAGTYMVRVATSAGVATRKLMVIK